MGASAPVRSFADQTLRILLNMRYERNEREVKNVRFCLFLQGSRPEPLPLSLLEAVPFGLIGLGLAVLDFTGASRKLEAVLRRYVEYERQYGHEARATLLTTDLQFHKKEFASFLPFLGAGLIILAAGWWLKRDGAAGQWLTHAVLSTPAWVLVVLVLGGIVVAYVLNHLLSQTFSYVMSLILWAPLWLLSRPKAGILGSCGLVVAVLDNVVT